MVSPRAQSFRERACPLGACDGSGWILGPEDVARPCDCREQRLRRGRSRGVSSVIPPRYRGVSFDRPPVSDMAETAVQPVRTYVRDLDQNLAAGRGIWFSGEVGTGKTTLAMLIAKSALERGYSVAIYSVPKLLARIRRTYEAEPGADPYHRFFEKLTSVDLLYLDDLGTERQTEWVLEQLYSIVNERYEAKRAIAFTTNGAEVEESENQGRRREHAGRPPELKVERQIGRRTFSRLMEMCGDPVLLFGEDQRYRNHAAHERMRSLDEPGESLARPA